MRVTKFTMKVILKNLTNFVLFGLVLVVAGNLFAQQTVKVSPANPEAGKTCIYKLEFTLPDSLPPKGVVVVVFPADFDLSGVTIGASSKIKGGFFTFVVGKEVLMIRKGKGEPHKAGEKVDAWLSAVKNPNSATLTYSTQVYIYEDGDVIASQIKAKTYKAKTNPKVLSGTFALTAKK